MPGFQFEKTRPYLLYRNTADKVLLAPTCCVHSGLCCLSRFGHRNTFPEGIQACLACCTLLHIGRAMGAWYHRWWASGFMRQRRLTRWRRYWAKSPLRMLQRKRNGRHANALLDKCLYLWAYFWPCNGLSRLEPTCCRHNPAMTSDPYEPHSDPQESDRVYVHGLQQQAAAASGPEACRPAAMQVASTDEDGFWDQQAASAPSRPLQPDMPVVQQERQESAGRQAFESSIYNPQNTGTAAGTEHLHQQMMDFRTLPVSSLPHLTAPQLAPPAKHTLPVSATPSRAPAVFKG